MIHYEIKGQEKGEGTHSSQRPKSREPVVIRGLPFGLGGVENRLLGTVTLGITAANHSPVTKVSHVVSQAARVGPDWTILFPLVWSCMVVVVLVVDHVRRCGLPSDVSVVLNNNIEREA